MLRGISPRHIPAVLFEGQLRIPRKYWGWVNLLGSILSSGSTPISAWPVDRTARQYEDEFRPGHPFKDSLDTNDAYWKRKLTGGRG
jgi:hypothetical protein